MALPFGPPTVLDLITLCMKEAGVIGVGQTPSSYDATDAVSRLNFILDEWNTQRWLVFRNNTIGFQSIGSQSYTVGPGQQYDTGAGPRPDRIESAFLRQTVPSFPNQLDYPLEILTSQEDYNTIPLKGLNSFPQYVWYDNQFPTGLLYPWPVPEASLYSVFITYMQQLVGVTSLTETISLPAQYYNAIYTNLAAILRDAYDLPPRPVLIGRAKQALNVIRGGNAQITRLRMPDELSRRGVYNIFTDQFR